MEVSIPGAESVQGVVESVETVEVVPESDQVLSSTGDPGEVLKIMSVSSQLGLTPTGVSLCVHVFAALTVVYTIVVMRATPTYSLRSARYS